MLVYTRAKQQAFTNIGDSMRGLEWALAPLLKNKFLKILRKVVVYM